jgi:hypothetical protein
MINMILQVSEQLGAASVAGQELHRQVGQQEQSSVSTGIRSRNSRAEGGVRVAQGVHVGEEVAGQAAAPMLDAWLPVLFGDSFMTWSGQSAN